LKRAAGTLDTQPFHRLATVHAELIQNQPRHHRCSFLVEHDVPVAAIKQWLGHGSEQMIRRYTHHRPEYHSAILAKIPSIFSVQNEPKPGLLVPNSPKLKLSERRRLRKLFPMLD
jgi:hypothetical protein